ncbi:MAG TPA: GDSL-type esterase/lipase family protein [Thermoanaerobaculia bacterium]|nr:GDSL-type esterase/lipase family protein [Thermoanaerobaculia bacterium]
MKRGRIASLLLFAALLAAGCSSLLSPPAAGVGAGFRWSAYGPEWDPGPEYWGLVGLEMARRFPGAVPETIWIVGKLNGRGTLLNFPVDARDPLISGSPTDANEATLSLFDRLGFRVWLQVEPGHASVEELIDLVMSRYGHHPSVVGFGVDVEWFRSTERPEGEPVGDAQARAWRQAVQKHAPHYRLFLKHWETGKMPPTEREGLLFVDDSQILPGLEAMVAEFARWGETFWPAPVAFQYGYESDRPWWSRFDDPPGEIGRAILRAVPNARGLYWVDFTAIELFPPATPDPGPPPGAPWVAAPKLDDRGRIDFRFEQRHLENLDAAERGGVGLLFLGDSITEGWLAGANRSIWDEHFGARAPANFGISGDRTQHLLWRIESGELDGIDPRVVVLLIGTNNIGDGVENIREGVHEVVRRIRSKLPESRLLLLAIFPRGADPADPEVAAMRAKIDAVNRSLLALDDGSRTRVLDLGPRLTAPDGTIPAAIMPDALHLSPRGYRIWAEAMELLLAEMME